MDTAHIGFRDEPSIKRKLEAAAKRERLTLTQVLQQAVRDYLTSHAVSKKQ